MIGRNSLGPVFTYDMQTQVRRWQVYGIRAGFVGFLLVAMLIAWILTLEEFGPVKRSPSIREMAVIGENFFDFLAGVQLSLILLAAPAAAAGSICIDRSRGTLLHMMVTDLSDAEIVLGRLGSRLMPVFGLVACGVPVMALAGLIGGVDFEALLGLFIVSIAVAILGCSLALAISVKASKTHEVLMAVYALFGIWLIASPIWWGFASSPKALKPLVWFDNLNPFNLVYAPYSTPGSVGLADFALFFAVALGVSAGLVAWSIWRIRRAVVQSSSDQKASRSRFARLQRLWPRLPGPSLDANPVLWREWHRNRPSRLARWIWGGLFVVTWGSTAWGIFVISVLGIWNDDSFLDFAFMIQVCFGFLMVAATSATVLAEERTRGSLDVLLSTPLSTRSIVLAKWWGMYRMIIGLAILPTILVVFVASASPNVPNYPTVVGFKPFPLMMIDRFAAVACCIADFLASGALIVSLGVLLATWISRIGRAVGASVVILVIFGVGWVFLIEMFVEEIFNLSHWGNIGLAALSPVFGPIVSFSTFENWTTEPRGWLWIYLAIVILIKAAVAGLLLGLTILTFNRCLGRVVESRPANFRPPTEANSHRPSRKRAALPPALAADATLVMVRNHEIEGIS